MSRMISVDGLVHGLSADYMTGKKTLHYWKKYPSAKQKYRFELVKGGANESKD